MEPMGPIYRLLSLSTCFFTVHGWGTPGAKVQSVYQMAAHGAREVLLLKAPLGQLLDPASPGATSLQGSIIGWIKACPPNGECMSQ
jgi:hypothetical protein